MQLHVERVGRGLHPKEVVVAVQTASGREELMVDARSLSGDMLEIGFPVGQRDELYLVELPQETFRGYWRVWVSKSDVHISEEPTRAYA